MPCNFVDGSGSVLLAVAGVYKFVVLSKRRSNAEGVQPYKAGDEDRGMQCSDDGETSVEIGKSLALRTLNV